MKKIVWTFGLISGGILAALLATTAPLCMDGKMSDYAEIIGYTAMVLAFLLVFFAIRSYRENVGGGTITFGKAFQVGLLVCLIASTCYVVAWEIVYYDSCPISRTGSRRTPSRECRPKARPRRRSRKRLRRWRGSRCSTRTRSSTSV